MKLKKLAVSLFSTMFMLSSINVVMTQEIIAADDAMESESKGIVILHTNDVHCGIDADEDTFGYAELAAYREKLESEGYTTLLVDAGDYSQGDVIGTVSSGGYLIDIMNELDYDVAVPGNHEYDYGMDRFYELAELSEFDVISSNFILLSTGKPVLSESVIKEVDGVKIAFIGITTPATVTSSTPKYFQNDKGEYIYGFCSGGNGQELYDKVQETVDKVKNDGADYVIALGHLGIGEGNEWTSDLVIANTTGIDVFIDGHSHSVIEGENYPDKNKNNVLLSSTGTKLSNFGAVTISNNSISAELISKSEYVYTEKSDSSETAAYNKVSDMIDKIQNEYDEAVNKVVGNSKVNLIANDPEDGSRLVRMQETNLGNYCADAYRTVTGADIGIVNGGGIRANINKGDITYGMFISVHPYCNEICMTEATGQDILNALEFGAMEYPDASGGFLQVSGLTYEIHSYLPSTVKIDENEEFISVEGEYRVKNVVVNGTPLDLNKTYTLATNNYIIKNGGDGYNMFKDNTLLLDSISLDNAALITYLNDYLDGEIGEEYAETQGRITIYTQNPSDKNEVTTTSVVTTTEAVNSEITGATTTTAATTTGTTTKPATTTKKVTTVKNAAPTTGDKSLSGIACVMFVTGIAVVCLNKKK